MQCNVQNWINDSYFDFVRLTNSLFAEVLSDSQHRDVAPVCRPLAAMGVELADNGSNALIA